MSRPLVDMRTVLERFNTLKAEAKRHASAPDNGYIALELHDAAMAYAAAVRKVARRDRGS